MKDRHDLLQGLRQTPNLLSELVRAIPEAKLDVRRGPGFWTIAEHVSHLAEVQAMLLERFQRFMNEEQPEFIPYIPQDDDKGLDAPVRMDLAAALEQFARYREKQVDLLESSDEAVWQKIGLHPEYERYSCHILVRHALMHDYWHMYRIEELWLARDPYLSKVQ